MNIQPVRIDSDSESKVLTNETVLLKDDDEIVLPPAKEPEPVEKECDLLNPNDEFDIDVNDIGIDEEPQKPKRNNLFGKVEIDEKNINKSVPLVYIGMLLGLIRFIS